MWPLASRLRANGFRVLNWNYLSLFAAIETHANRLCDFLATQLSLEPRFHIVAHSMGSIVTRAALKSIVASEPWTTCAIGSAKRWFARCSFASFLLAV